jgi:hypothetical protein
MDCNGRVLDLIVEVPDCSEAVSEKRVLIGFNAVLESLFAE